MLSLRKSSESDVSLLKRKSSICSRWAFFPLMEPLGMLVIMLPLMSSVVMGDPDEMSSEGKRERRLLLSDTVEALMPL